MNWTLIGWVIIGLAAILLAVLSWGVKIKGVPPRKMGFFRHLLTSRTATLEQGRSQQVILGNNFWSRAYPGLGLTGLAALPSLLTPEVLAEGQQAVSTASGSLALFARQIVEGHYTSGFSEQLLDSRVEAGLYGLTPFSFTAGLLPELKRTPYGTLIYLGDFGPEAVLSIQAAARQGGQVFAAAGSLTAQAALFLSVRELLLGEEVFLLPAALAPTPSNQASLWVEDLLRLALMGLLVAGAILKMTGVL